LGAVASEEEAGSVGSVAVGEPVAAAPEGASR
jgi:hypothetical protein